MDGLLFLLLMFWIFKKLAKGLTKKKVVKQSSSDVRTARMVEEIKRVRKEKQVSVNEPASSVLGEGESSMSHVQDMHGCISPKPEYMGSLFADTSEGEDACDPLLEHEKQPSIAGESVYANEIGRASALDLSASGIYQGVVMSEILNRPSRGMRRRA